MRMTMLFCGLSLLTCSAFAEEAPSLEALHLQIPSSERGSIQTEIVQTNADGTVVVQIKKSIRNEQAPAFIEGYYLALGTKKETLGIDGAIVFRLKVEEVLSEKQARLSVDKAAAREFASIENLYLFRPIGTSTATMKSIPAVAPIVEESDSVKGDQSKDLLTSKNNLKQIGIALHNFHERYGHFPPSTLTGPDGKPWHSWRVLLLPYLNQKKLYERYRFDEPWNGPNNKKLIAEMPDLFHDPVHGKQSKEGYTHYAAVVGENAGFVTAKFSGKANDLNNTFEQGTQIRSFIDGPSNTVLVGSISPKKKIAWTKPEDLTLGEKTPKIGDDEKGFAAPYESRIGKAGLFLRCDGSVSTIRTDIDPEQWTYLLQRNDGNVIHEIPSLDRPNQNEKQVPVLSYRKTDKGYEAVLGTALVTDHSRRRGDAGSAIDAESDAIAPAP